MRVPNPPATARSGVPVPDSVRTTARNESAAHLIAGSIATSGDTLRVSRLVACAVCSRGISVANQGKIPSKLGKSGLGIGGENGSATGSSGCGNFSGNGDDGVRIAGAVGSSVL